MIFWMASAVGLAIAYLLGSTPAGYLAGTEPRLGQAGPEMKI
jgi:glycerol-3-phosphate acyltransferase PlsY